jgi:Holliday junction resolvasome RuvABC DNA-binding subunit
MTVLASFPDLLTLVLSGVTAHNGLQILASRLNRVATAVDQGDVKTLAHDAHGVVDWVETHDPALAKAAEAEALRLKGEAMAEVVKVRHDAAEEIRKLATAVESAATALPVTPVEAAPATPAGS